MLGREDKVESIGHSGQAGSGFFGNARGVSVQYYADAGAVVGIELPEKGYELAATMTLWMWPLIKSSLAIRVSVPAVLVFVIPGYAVA